MAASLDTIVGANAERSRSHNRQVVLGRVRAAGEIGRAEIARLSGLSTQAVSNIIAELLSDGLIKETGRRAVGRGLPALQYGLNAKGGFALGIEIRPDAVFAAVLDLCGNTLASKRQSLNAPTLSDVTETVLRVRNEVQAKAGVRAGTSLGIGIVMPGPFGETGIRGNRSGLDIWDDVIPSTWFANALQSPVIIENDANAAAIAEHISGVARGLQSFAYLYFGSGLGLGLVHKGQLIEGAFGNAGEIGHIPVPSIKGTVLLEDAVSRLSLQKHLNAEGIEATSVHQMSELHRKGNEALQDWLDRAVEPLEAALTIVENMFDPEAVILGGAMPDSVINRLIEAVDQPERSVAHRSDRVVERFLRGTSGRMTATLGAAALVIHQATTPRISATVQ